MFQPTYIHVCLCRFPSLSLSLGRGSSLSDYVLYVCVCVMCNVNLCVCVRACVLYVYVCICECHVSMCAWLCMCDNLLCLESRQSCINTANHTTSQHLAIILPSRLRHEVHHPRGKGRRWNLTEIRRMTLFGWFWATIDYTSGCGLRMVFSNVTRDHKVITSQNANSKQNGFGYPHWWNSWGNIRFVLWCRGTWKGP